MAGKNDYYGGVWKLRDALREAERLGARVEYRHKTGEVDVFHPLLQRECQGQKNPRLRMNCRRKDATSELMALLRKIEREQGRPS